MLIDGYFEMDRVDKILYWARLIYRHMRWMGESGKDEMGVFDAKLIEGFRQADPDIDALMSPILTYVSRMWLENPAEFLSKANAGMGTPYAVDKEIAEAKFGMRTG